MSAGGEERLALEMVSKVRMAWLAIVFSWVMRLVAEGGVLVWGCLGSWLRRVIAVAETVEGPWQ